jgi:hypothetical protein
MDRDSAGGAARWPNAYEAASRAATANRLYARNVRFRVRITKRSTAPNSVAGAEGLDHALNSGSRTLRD